ncbi:hypothetical protein [Pseudomonas sp. HY7a-MNA-CIBAN-0227]|uniref:hypothetical protein n=1 Tax=Pseudomonas sp. HY7a-MNA-CIBAN-0227 TaxID=3140474 RepID=UPI003317AEF5
MISKNKLAKALKGNFLAATLLVFGIIMDVAYISLSLLSDPTPFVELPVFGKIALALPLFAVMLYAYQKLASIATGHDQIQQLMNIAKETKNEDSHEN